MQVSMSLKGCGYLPSGEWDGEKVLVLPQKSRWGKGGALVASDTMRSHHLKSSTAVAAQQQAAYAADSTST